MSTLKVGEIKHENFTGTTQLKLDNSGRLLLGTTTEGHENADDLTIATSGTTGITLRSGTSGAGNIYFSDATSGNAEYDGYISYTQSINKLQFGTNQNTRMAIDSSGNVGIGTTSPITPLHVKHATTNGVATFESGDATCLINFKDNSTSSSPSIGTVGNDLKLVTADVNRVTVLNTGNVGIGTESPGLPLHVKHATSNGILKVESGDSNCGITIADNSGEVSVRAIGNALTFNTSSSETERMRIDSSGNVGIGTTSPDDFDADCKDLVISRSGHAGITINSGSAGSTSNGNIAFAEGTAGSADKFRGGIQYTHGSDHMTFFTNATERLRITTSGIFPVAHGQTFNSSQLPNGNSFQINTTSSSHGLSVTRYSTNYAGYALNIGRSKSNTIGTNSLVGNTDDLGHITWYGADGTDFNQAAAISALVDGTPSGGEDMPGALAFKTTPEGSGSPQSRMWIASNGRVAIGTSLGTNAAGKFQVVEESGSDQANDCNAYFETNAGDWNIKTYYNKAGTHYHLVFVEQGTERGNVSGSDGSNVTFNQGSDYRWKENVVRMTGDEGIEICKKLKPSKYNWIENRETTGQINTVDGFIAHEVVEAGVLGAVTGEKDAVKEDGSIKGQMLDYGQMTPVLAAGIKGLIAKIEVLETKVAALEAK